MLLVIGLFKKQKGKEKERKKKEKKRNQNCINCIKCGHPNSYFYNKRCSMSL